MSHRFLGFDHVQLAAPPGSESRARNFFHSLLGMEEIQKPPHLAVRGGVWFRCGNKQLHIGIENDFGPAKKAHPAFEVQHIEELRRLLVASNVEVMDDEPLEGAARFYAKDPFGNRLEFIEWTTTQGP